MKSQNEAVDESSKKIVFDPDTGAFNGSLGGGEIEDDFDGAFDDVFEGEFEGEAFESADLGAALEPSPESESELTPEQELNSLESVLQDRESLFRMAQELQLAEGVRNALNDRAAQTVRLRQTTAGMIANRLSYGIAVRRELRKGASFEKSLAQLEALTLKATPQNFNPDDPESLKQASKYFNSAKGRQDIDSIKNAYQKTLKKGDSLLKGHRSADVQTSSNSYQEQVLKKLAHYIDENEKLLKHMKSDKDGDKNLFTDFKSGFDGLLGAAKAVFARLAVLLGAMNGVKAVNAEQQENQGQDAGKPAPPPQGYKPQMGPR